MMRFFTSSLLPFCRIFVVIFLLSDSASTFLEIFVFEMNILKREKRREEKKREMRKINFYVHEQDMSTIEKK
jgi:hypothetical protein